MENNEQVIVVKDRKSREIHTFVNLDGHGARVNLEAFVSLIAENYGSPATTMTRSQHLAGLLQATEKAIWHMKSQTREVAALSIEPHPS